MSQRLYVALSAIAIVGLATLNVAQLQAARDEAREPSLQEVKRRFVDWWGHEQNFFFANTWFGVKTLQNPMDAWVTQEILSEVRPDVLVEAGTFHGGSALMWASILEEVNPDARILTIDVEDRTEEAAKVPIWARRVEFLHGSSTDPEIVEAVRQRVEGKRVLVILDSLHTHEHVRKELDIYPQMVPVGSYVIVQDTGLWRPFSTNISGAASAVADFLASTDEFESDTSRERFILTNNPTGFLRRVR